MSRFFAGFTLIDWPIFGLIFFVVLFSVVAYKTLRQKPDDDIISLPLQDDEKAHTTII